MPLNRRDFLKTIAGIGAITIVSPIIVASPLESIAQEQILHSVPPIKPGTKYALFRAANHNDVLDSMDALVGEYNTQLDAFNALKLVAVPNAGATRRHYLVGNGRVLALTQVYQSGFGANDAFYFAKEKKIPVYMHAVDINEDGYIKGESEITPTYFFLDEQFAKDTKPRGGNIVKVTPEGDIVVISGGKKRVY